MSRLTDELLSAYIDGELGPAEAAQVALALARDRKAARRLDELRRSDSALEEVFAWPLSGEAAVTASAAAKMQALDRRRSLAHRLTIAAASLAAAAAGFAVGKLTMQRDVQIDPELGAVAQGQLARALDDQASNVEGPVRILLTARMADGRVCRRFSAGPSLQGLACREDGRWRLAALIAPGETLGAREQVLDMSQERALIGSHWAVAAPDQPQPRG